MQMRGTRQVVKRATRLLLVAMVAATAWVIASTYAAPEGGWVGAHGAQAANREPNLPQWQHRYAAEFPGCHAGHGLADQVLVVDLYRHPHRMAFDAAWKAAHDHNAANDVWVVGTC